jgi:hypothetical protein
MTDRHGQIRATWLLKEDNIYRYLWRKGLNIKCGVDGSVLRGRQL